MECPDELENEDWPLLLDGIRRYVSHTLQYTGDFYSGCADPEVVPVRAV